MTEDRMRIRIRVHNVELTEAIRAHVERRIGFALGRFGAHVDSVTVRFSDTNGHRRGIDKRCQIDVGWPSVRVEATDTDLFAAVDRAAHRAARAVAHALEREHECDNSALRWLALGDVGGLRADAGPAL
jgi:putative sigma-54 modulation protein